MSVAKEDPDPAMRRVAVRAVSGAMGRRVFIRVDNPAGRRMFFQNRGAVIDGKDSDDLGYQAFDQFPDSEDEVFLQPEADFDFRDDSADIESRVEPLARRVRRLQERIREIPLPKFHGDDPESRKDMHPIPELPSNQPSASPSPNQ
jgi:hypothetical protein